MDIQGEEYSRESTTSFNTTNQAPRRPRVGVRHHHGYPPYDVWDESIPYLPASIPSTLVPPPQRCLRIIQPTRSTPSAQHCPSSATYTESDALPCSDQEGGISHATRRHMPTQPRTTCTVPDPYRPLRQFDLRGSSQHGTTTQHLYPLSIVITIDIRTFYRYKEFVIDIRKVLSI